MSTSSKKKPKRKLKGKWTIEISDEILFDENDPVSRQVAEELMRDIPEKMVGVQNICPFRVILGDLELRLENKKRGFVLKIRRTI